MSKVPPAGSGLIRTFLVFVDLPVHLEFLVSPMPLMSEGTVIHFDLVLRDPADRRRSRKVDGQYRVLRPGLRYTSDNGLSQYLELEPVK